MNTSFAPSRRRRLASTGAVLGLLATLGLAAPAHAAIDSPSTGPVVQTERNNGDQNGNNGGNNNNGNNNGNNHRNNGGNNNNGDNHRNNGGNNNNGDNHRNNGGNNNGDNNRDHNNNWSNWNNNRHDDADLSLRINDDGDYRIRGNDYDSNRVKVWLVNVSKDRTVEVYYVKAHDGDFTIHGDDLRCDRTYQAVSWSNHDGRVWSNKVRLHCD